MKAPSLSPEAGPRRLAWIKSLKRVAILHEAPPTATASQVPSGINEGHALAPEHLLQRHRTHVARAPRMHLTDCVSMMLRRGLARRPIARRRRRARFRRRRRAMGRRAKPRLSIIDTQSVKCIPVRGPRGYDAAKKVLGRKRVALVDADGTWLAVAVVPASVQDRDTLEALDPGKAAWPSLREAILDGAFTAASCHEWSNRHGMRHRVVERDPAQKGFVVLAGRWVVERSFGWLVHWGGLLRDRAGRLDVSAARIAFAAVLSGVEALLNPMPVQDAAS